MPFAFLKGAHRSPLPAVQDSVPPSSNTDTDADAGALGAKRGRLPAATPSPSLCEVDGFALVDHRARAPKLVAENVGPAALEAAKPPALPQDDAELRCLTEGTAPQRSRATHGVLVDLPAAEAESEPMTSFAAGSDTRHQLRRALHVDYALAQACSLASHLLQNALTDFGLEPLVAVAKQGGVAMAEMGAAVVDGWTHREDSFAWLDDGGLQTTPLAEESATYPGPSQK